MNFKRPLVIFIIGVSGVGKSTIGELLSTKLSIPFFDGDDFHPLSNIDKMKSGIPLNDDDRQEWLLKLNILSQNELKKGSCIIACSALKEFYRIVLSQGIEEHVKWILLHGTFEEITTRLKQRSGHFMPSKLLQSQFDTLETPINAFQISIEKSPNEIATTIENELMNKTEFGVIGLGVMGKSLARNLANQNFKLSLFNRHVDGVEENIAQKFKNEFSELADALTFDNLQEFVNSLQTPRKILLMVNAGKPVDLVLEQLVTLLSENDIIIDGGNSHYQKTKKRNDFLKQQKLFFIGAGISGGEEGALKGPSIMPGGNKMGYPLVKPFLEAIAARDKNNNPCCTYIGDDGSGHFVKMVHNGIEYAEMQLLAEVYFILKRSGKNPDEIAAILETWKTDVNSYLLEITIEILKTKEGNDWLIDKILDVSGNKGTGNWTTIATSKLGMPSTLIPTALFARYISSFKEERMAMSAAYSFQEKTITVDPKSLKKAYQLASIINHHQGFKLLSQGSISNDWNLNLSEIARIWTNGCIIRSDYMENVVDLLKETDSILLNKQQTSLVKSLKSSLTKLVQQCLEYEVPVPCFSEAINFLNGYTTAASSANLIQAQRDYFGAHTYQRIDDPSKKTYHTHWKSINHD